MIRTRMLSSLALVLSLILVSFASTAAQDKETRLPVGIRGEILAEVEVPASALPGGETAAMIGWFSWKENTADGVPAGTFEKGIIVDVVVEGAYALRSGGPLHLLRDGVEGPPEEVAPGDEAVIATGDAVLYLENDASWEFRNAAPSRPGLALEAMILSTDPPALPVESVVDPDHVDDDPALHLEVLNRAIPEIWADGAPGPLLLTIWRGELAPGGSIAAAEDGVVQVVAPESGDASALTIGADGAARNDGDDPVAVVGLTAIPA